MAKILIACEFSGRVRNAFAAIGHEVWSCDLYQPSDDNSPFHLRQDCIELAYTKQWDMMVAHPPCTYLTNSGERWMQGNFERQKLRIEAIEFTKKLLNAPIKKICIENPVGALSRYMCKPTQIIEPWFFGHEESKATCLWLVGLPKLIPTNIVKNKGSKIHKMAPSIFRWKDRSRTYQGIASAMASQWGQFDE